MKPSILACVALLALVSAAAAKPPQTDEQRTAAVQSLKWRDGETLTLPVSQATLNAPEPVKQLVGPDAVTLWEALNGLEAPTNTEAALYDPASQTLVFYQKLGDGYVKLDDWSEVDADAMLKSVTENTEADNERRKTAGLAAVHVVGWLERPHLDRASNTVRWSFEARDEQAGPLVNSIALVLARDGFEKLIWVGPTIGTDTPELLKIAQASFAFPAGRRYADFQAGDKVAEYGIAGLVAAVLGAKAVSKLGLLAAVAVFAKKFWFLLFLPLAVGWRWLKRLFTGNRPA
jgi:uncharacterized membrane-anchored protein